ncbi:hypothetical protein SDC9_67588 [bioreactor metagenome]|uniref:Uncharacterized protein n=1 Tax=bioreactor metagenome TaxID=1076179 RepID=A0A644XY62_9ZZZZ
MKGSGEAASAGDRRNFLAGGKNHGEKGKIVIKEKPGKESETFADGVAQAAVNGLIIVQFPDFQFALKGPYISEHDFLISVIVNLRVPFFFICWSTLRAIMMPRTKPATAIAAQIPSPKPRALPEK